MRVSSGGRVPRRLLWVWLTARSFEFSVGFTGLFPRGSGVMFGVWIGASLEKEKPGRSGPSRWRGRGRSSCSRGQHPPSAIPSLRPPWAGPVCDTGSLAVPHRRREGPAALGTQNVLHLPGARSFLCAQSREESKAQGGHGPRAAGLEHSLCLGSYPRRRCLCVPIEGAGPTQPQAAGTAGAASATTWPGMVPVEAADWL